MSLGGITVELSIILGSADVPIQQMLKMGRGSTIPLDCSYSDPSLVVVNDQVVADGRIIVDGDRMSIEIAHVAQRSR